uniref:Novel STAND NTPase 3 domain-containing protein n=1 Tax=Magallana gigas TaxID=29159 RepID=A0A8W8IKX2_MAGGI
MEKSIFDQWEQDESCFISTNACEEVEKIIKSRNLVIVGGHSGSGKSAIIQHIALKYRKQGWTVRRVTEVKEIVNEYSSSRFQKNKTICVFNDPLGKESFDEILNNSWQRYEEEITTYLKTAKLFMSCRNYIISEKNKEYTEKFKHGLNLCGFNSMAPFEVGNNLDSLNEYLVKKVGDTYHFYHDFVMEVTTHVFGTDYPTETIKYADIGFLRRRVKLGNFDKHDDSFTIYLSDKYIEKLGERLYTELFGERVVDVVLNPCLKNEKVIEVLQKKIAETGPDVSDKTYEIGILDSSNFRPKDHMDSTIEDKDLDIPDKEEAFPNLDLVVEQSQDQDLTRLKLHGSTRKTHANDIRLANVDQWTVPSDNRPRMLRRAQYAEPPNTDDPSSGTSSEDEGPEALDDKFRDERTDSSDEDDIPLAELQRRIRHREERLADRPNELSDQLTLDPDDIETDETMNNDIEPLTDKQLRRDDIRSNSDDDMSIGEVKVKRPKSRSIKAKGLLKALYQFL